MNFRPFIYLCAAMSMLIGCVTSSEDESSTGEPDEEIISQKEQEHPPVPENDSPPQAPKKEKQEPGFDSCPSDTYVLWEKDGISYVIKIEVFCDPIQGKLNLGCPAPFDGEVQSSDSCKISSGL